MKRVDEIAKVCPLHFVEMEPGKLIPHTSTKVHFRISVLLNALPTLFAIKTMIFYNHTINHTTIKSLINKQ